MVRRFQRAPTIDLTIPSEVDDSLTTVPCARPVASTDRAARRMHSLEVVDEQRMMTAPAFLDIMARWQPQIGLVDERLRAACTREERLTSRERLWAALDLLSRLEETVGPVPDHLMQQVLNALHTEILRPTLRLSERQLAIVMTTLSELNHEATRATPDVAQFCQRASLVIDIMLLA